MKRRVAHFCLIGFIAFAFDAISYFIAGLVFSILLGQDVPLMQKLIGFSIGVVTTYLYNSRITFSVSYSWGRFRKYLCAQFLGMAINLATFLVIRSLLPAFVAIATATLFAAVVNFIGASRSLRSRAHVERF